MNRIPTSTQIQIESSQPYRYFLDSLGSEYTKKTYAHALRQFFDYLQIKNPDISTIIGREPKIIEAEIIDYVAQLKHKGLSYSRLNVVLAAIFHFYMINDVTLNKNKISRFIGKKAAKTWGERGRGYTPKQIAQMLTIADERTGAMILFLASTGIRIGALPGMKLKHLVIEDGNTSTSTSTSIYRISVYDGEYFTFCTPEATNAIKRYFEYRFRSGEKLGPDSPLIREQFDREDTLKVRHPKTVSRSSMVSLLTETMIKAGLKQLRHLMENETTGKSRNEIPLNHGFRKFFNTALMNADVHPSFKKLLMGHSVQLDEVYYDKGSDKSRAKLLEEYSKAIDALTINEENRLRKKVEELTPKSDEMQAMRNELAATKEQMEQICASLGLDK
jgi:integrase